MTRKTAEDLAEIIAEAAEDLEKTARMEARSDCADALADMVKNPDQFAEYLTTGTQTLSTGTKVTYKSYLPGQDPETFEATEDFANGIKFAIALLRNADHEF